MERVITRVLSNGDLDVRVEEVSLSENQVRILELLCQGYLRKEIGGVMYLEENTIKYHLTQIRRKLGARTNEQAVALYLGRYEATH